jgi:hypothetical protein
MTVEVGCAWRISSHAIEWPVAAQRVEDPLARSCFQCFSIGFGQRGDRGGGVGLVTGKKGGVVGPWMMVCDARDVIERVDGVGGDVVLGAKVRGPVCGTIFGCQLC